MIEHPDNESSLVWRYVDLAKFLDLIQTSELHFTRLDQLEDPYEQAIQTAACRRKPMDSETMYVNCWVLSEYESAAMWTIYGGSSGIALQSSRSRIGAVLDVLSTLEGIEGASTTAFGPVRYLDDRHIAKLLATTGEPPTNTVPVFNKRMSSGRHLRRCRCPHFRRGKISYHAHFGVKLFHRHLIERGICKSQPVQEAPVAPVLVTAFCDWFRTHRGVKEPTLRHYARGATDLLWTLGEDVTQWNARALRDFLLERARQCGTSTTQKLITSLRAFLRFLTFRGECRDDLASAIPAVAHWRLARLPRCLSAEEIDRLIAASDGTTPGRLRDRAILLMLARLGLRSGDVAALRLGDIDWNNGTLQVTGKGRYQVRLPLPQDVGDALLRYLDGRPANFATDHVFMRSSAPCGPFASGDGVSSVVKHALRRANIDTPARGAHLLRHTAATEMLRNGVPLDQAGLVLRHRSIDMTAYYAKADVALLKQIAQPWPEVKS